MVKIKKQDKEKMKQYYEKYLEHTGIPGILTALVMLTGPGPFWLEHSGLEFALVKALLCQSDSLLPSFADQPSLASS